MINANALFDVYILTVFIYVTHYICAQEREARLNLMRKRAHERDGFSDGEEEPVRKEAKVGDSSEAAVTTERGHINFFADVKQGVGYNENTFTHTHTQCVPFIFEVLVIMLTGWHADNKC